MAAFGVSGCGMSVAGCSVLNTTTTSRKAHQGDNDMDAVGNLYKEIEKVRRKRDALARLIATDVSFDFPPSRSDLDRFRQATAELNRLREQLYSSFERAEES